MQPWKLVPLRICHRRKAAEFTSTGIPEVDKEQSQTESGTDHAWHPPPRSAGQLHNVLSCPQPLSSLRRSSVTLEGESPFPEEVEKLLPLGSELGCQT